MPSSKPTDPCPSCGGSGYEPGPETSALPCGVCDGRGQLRTTPEDTQGQRSGEDHSKPPPEYAVFRLAGSRPNGWAWAPRIRSTAYDGETACIMDTADKAVAVAACWDHRDRIRAEARAEWEAERDDGPKTSEELGWEDVWPPEQPAPEEHESVEVVEGSAEPCDEPTCSNAASYEGLCVLCYINRVTDRAREEGRQEGMAEGYDRAMGRALWLARQHDEATANAIGHDWADWVARDKPVDEPVNRGEEHLRGRPTTEGGSDE